MKWTSQKDESDFVASNDESDLVALNEAVQPCVL